MTGRHILLHLSHFLGAVLIMNILYSVLPCDVTNYFFKFSNLLICACVAQVTSGISKKIFFRERLKPDHKAVLITGCARGIGNALAKHLDLKGYLVFASCRDTNTPQAEDLKRSCSNRLKVFQLDVTKDESVQKAVQFVKENLGTCELWAIINNAGIQNGFFLELTSNQEFKDNLEVNAIGPVRVTKAFLPLLRQSRGRVINMASITGRLASPVLVAYSMSKSACIAFSESLRYEMDLWGVQVISIEPEIFETDMVTKMGERIDAMPDDVDEDVEKYYLKEILQAFKSITNTMFPPSPNVQKITETVECAISLKHPDVEYKVFRNFGVRAIWIILVVLPAEFKVFIVRRLFYFFGVSKLMRVKKSV